VDVGLSIQYLLNCGAGTAGSCHGGSTAGAYDFIERVGYIPFETCLAYEACSSDSIEGACGQTVGEYSCSVRLRGGVCTAGCGLR
jgi:cathepsin X